MQGCPQASTRSSTRFGAKDTPKSQGCGSCCPQAGEEIIETWPTRSSHALRRTPLLGSCGAVASTAQRCARWIGAHWSVPAGGPRWSSARTTPGSMTANSSTSSRSGWPKQNAMASSFAPLRGRNRALGHNFTLNPESTIEISLKSRAPEQGLRDPLSESCGFALPTVDTSQVALV